MRLKKYAAGVLLFLAACTSGNEKKLPILGTREPVEKVVDGKTVVDTIYQSIPSFRFINQDSVFITDKNFDDKIYVADFFFTSCTSICPIMHRNMLKVYDEFKNNPEVKILSHSIDFKYDTPSRLKRYATKLGVQGDQWEFVNGSRDSIYQIAEKSYLTAVGEDKQAEGGFIHQGWFVLVDKNKHLRGAYDGTQPDQVEQLIEDMKILLAENKE
ncbi:SCO family protein [Rubrolithibacter danxiaensis]|uniref:SCO family protein n=1 Tax=Rubrolithibacter danxiaensis TaxID=3390805 RepID=UPI003BF8571D